MWLQACNARLCALDDHAVVKELEAELDLSRLVDPVVISKRSGENAQRRKLVQRGRMVRSVATRLAVHVGALVAVWRCGGVVVWVCGSVGLWSVGQGVGLWA